MLTEVEGDDVRNHVLAAYRVGAGGAGAGGGNVTLCDQLVVFIIIAGEGLICATGTPELREMCPGDGAGVKPPLPMVLLAVQIQEQNEDRPRPSARRNRRWRTAVRQEYV